VKGSGCDEGESYCYECCVKKVAQIIDAHPEASELAGICVDGGCDNESDHPAYCSSCGVQLSCTLTDEGSDSELEALLGDAKPSLEDQYGWRAMQDAIEMITDDDLRWPAIIAVIELAQRLPVLFGSDQ